MSYERARHECDECGAKFLTKNALNGHQSLHAEEIETSVVKGR